MSSSPDDPRALTDTSGVTPAPSEPYDVNAALERLRGRKTAAIFMHDNPDPDSLAAAVGLSRLLQHRLGMSVTLALGGIVGRAENRAMVEALGIPLVPVPDLAGKTFDCRGIVDSQPGTGNNSLRTGDGVDIIVDHHPARGDIRHATWCDIRPDLGATSTIVLEYLRACGVPLDAGLATGLFYALRTETRDLGRESSPAERDAYLHLISQVDHDLLYRISHPKVKREHFVALDRALRSARVYDDIVVANLDELGYPDLVAEVADLLLAFEGSRFVLCGGRYQGRVYVSLRTDPGYGRAGSLMRKTIGTLGAAGGHGTMAGGSLHQTVASPGELQPLFDTLVQRFHEALGRTMPGPTPLIT